MAEGLLDPRTIRQLAAELDLRPTKQRGQNFVHDPNTVRFVAERKGVELSELCRVLAANASAVFGDW